MDIVDIILLASALGIDCLIVSFSQGIIFKSNRIINSLKLASVMGGFQGVFPLIGYIATDKVYDFLIPCGKWLVFALFMLLGLHFILDGLSKTEQEPIQCLDFKCLIGLGIATSIDALISGATLKLTDTKLFLACLIIGLFSFIMSLCGFWIGSFIKNIPSKYLHFIGGLILIGLAIKTLIV